MTVVHAVREVQIPLLAAMLLGGCGTKLLQLVRASSPDDRIGPTALFPAQLRRPLAIVLCAVEGGLGLGLIVTAGPFGEQAPADSIRAGSSLLFLVATCALLELRQTRPEAGCGCFGDFSTAPVSARTLARSALFAVAGLITVRLGPIAPPRTAAGAFGLLAILGTEVVLIAALSPELGVALIRLGYSEPCEFRHVPAARTLAVLRRSKHWRRYSSFITSTVPADMWRELCWRFIVFPGSYAGQPAEVVFAVFLQRRRSAVRVALVDASTGAPLEWPTGRPGSRRLGRAALRRVTQGLSPAPPAIRARTAPDLPLSIDL